MNEKTFIIPELQEKEGQSGYFTLDKKTSLVISPAVAKIQKTVETSAKDSYTIFKKKNSNKK